MEYMDDGHLSLSLWRRFGCSLSIELQCSTVQHTEIAMVMQMSVAKANAGGIGEAGWIG